MILCQNIYQILEYNFSVIDASDVCEVILASREVSDEIITELASLFKMINDEEVSEDRVMKLVKNDEVVREHKKWKSIEIDSERLYQILTRHLGDESKESGDYHKAIQLYTDSMREIKQDTDRDNILYSRALCYFHTEQFNLCVEVFSNH